MPSTPLTDAIVALTTYANTVTGESDTTLSAAVDSLAAGYGQGGIMSLIDTVTVPSDSRTFNLDLTPYSSYPLIWVVEDVTLDASDWLYYVGDGSTPSGGEYSNNKREAHHGMIFGSVLMSPTDHESYFMIGHGATGATITATRFSNIFIYAYSASHVIKAGGTFKIYGGSL